MAPVEAVLHHSNESTPDSMQGGRMNCCSCIVTSYKPDEGLIRTGIPIAKAGRIVCSSRQEEWDETEDVCRVLHFG